LKINVTDKNKNIIGIQIIKGITVHCHFCFRFISESHTKIKPTMKNNQLNKRPYGTDEIKVAVSVLRLQEVAMNQDQAFINITKTFN